MCVARGARLTPILVRGAGVMTPRKDRMIDLFIGQRMVSLRVCEHTMPCMHISQDPASWIVDTEAGGELGRVGK